MAGRAEAGRSEMRNFSEPAAQGGLLVIIMSTFRFLSRAKSKDRASMGFETSNELVFIGADICFVPEFDLDRWGCC